MLNYKPLRYLLTTLFALGAIALIGILSFSGMLYLSNNVVASITSSILAVLIEGEIYKQNIFSGLGKLLHCGEFIRRNNYCNKLKELANNEALRNNCPLLKEYYQTIKLHQALHHANNLSDSQKADLAKTETSITELEDFFIRYLNNEIDEKNPTVMALVTGLFSSKIEKSQIQNNLQANIRWEKTLLWLSMPITVIGGAMAVLVTASQLSAAFVTFGITITPILMCTLVWPIAALAAIGFMIMIYKTFVDIIHHKTLQKHWNSFIKLFTKETSLTIKILYVIGIALLTVLAIVATIATAGTWWTFAQTGLTLLPFLSKLSSTIRTVITSIGMFLLGITLFFFDYVNSLESFKVMTAKLSRENVPKTERANVEKMPQLKKLFTIMRYNIQHAFNKWAIQPWGVMLNPFTWLNRIIEVPFRFVLFIGHIISIGVTSDRIGDLNAAIPAAIGTAQEAVIDYHYFPNTGDHHHKHHKHDPIDHDDHDHNHSDLAGYFLNVVLFPTKLCSALWNSAFGDKTFPEYFNNEFGVSREVKTTPHQESAKWQHYKIDQTLTDEIVRLERQATSDPLARDKKDIFEKTRDQIRKSSPELRPFSLKAHFPLMNILTKKELQLLSRNRSRFFALDTTKSLQTIHEINDKYPKVAFF